MAQISMEQLRAKLLAEKQKKTQQASGGGTGGDNASFPFWNIPEGQSASVRFLPDGDTENDFWWRKREIIKLPFAGIVGGDFPTTKTVTVQVPCVEMWGDRCPILQHTKPWWKDPSQTALARVYWKKKSYLFQGFVVHSPFEEQQVPENPIRRFVINPSIFEIIYDSLMNPDMEDNPTDYKGGRDFKIAKTRKGEYANYSTSSWSFKTRSLSEDELQAIETHKLWVLKDFLGRRPDDAELEMIYAMFLDSLEGKPFDHDSYGKHFRAFGSRDDAAAAAPAPQATTQVQAASVRVVSGKPTAAPVAEAPAIIDEDEPEAAPRVTRAAEPPARVEKSGDVSAILARIKGRQPQASGSDA